MPNYQSSSSNTKQIEQTKGDLANKLIVINSCLIGLTIIESFLLILVGRLEPDKAVTLILAVSSIFSGLLGSAITYYFSKT